MTDMTKAPMIGRQMRARFSLAGASGEMERTLPLDEAERVAFSGSMRLRARGRLPRPVLLRVTPKRIGLLLHYALRPDTLFDIPHGAVTAIELGSSSLDLAWRADRASAVRVLTLAGWTGRPMLANPLTDVAEVASVLQDWLNSPSGDIEIHTPHSHRSRRDV